MTSNKKAVWGWAMYDWANSAFATTVMAGFFPIFFKEYWSLGANVNVSTARLGVANALAGLLVAVLAPFLGAVADRAGVRKRFLLLFAYLGVLMSGALFFIEKGEWVWAAAIYVLGAVGFSGANVFYDALLPSVAAEDRLDRVSSIGYALGYLGGGLLFVLNVAMTLAPQRFGLPDAATAVRCSFLSVAVWWGGFTLFTIFWVPRDDRRPGGASWKEVMGDATAQVMDMCRSIFRQRTIGLFLLAYWCYIDGVHTIIRMATDYGLSLGFAKTDLITALLVVQFVGFPAAAVFGMLGEKWGARRAIFLGIGAYLLITCWGAMITDKREFYILAASIGLFQGGLQALSRSYYSRLFPKESAARYFGLYNLIGKFAVIIGPVLMAATGLLARKLLMPGSPTQVQLDAIGMLASRWSIGSLTLLFSAGAMLFYFSGKEKKGR
jgi:UMF1 family MFS transporter